MVEVEGLRDPSLLLRVIFLLLWYMVRSFLPTFTALVFSCRRFQVLKLIIKPCVDD